MNKDKPVDYKCVTLKGELADWGKHILLPSGFTLCGMPTVDADKERFQALKHENFSDMINEYTIEDWDITCEKCLELIDMMAKHRENKKAKYN